MCRYVTADDLDKDMEKDLCDLTQSRIEERQKADANARRAWSMRNAMSEKRSEKYEKGDTVYIQARVAHVGDCGQIYVSIPMPGHNPYALHKANYAKLTPDMGSVYREKQQEPVKQTVILEKE